jgi:glycosyltransferase involved in cell wall biosynthesis
VQQFNQPLVSIITVVYNNSKHIRATIESVLSQDYSKIEHIVIDGGSTDGTIEIIEEYGDKISVFLSEPDEGIYDALNKGIVRANGDYLGILHSDDIFCDDKVVSDIVQKLRDTETELCFSDLVIVDEVSGKVMRYVMAHYFRQWMLRIGFFPPHPTIFLKRSIFDEFGLYSKNYKIAGDFDFLIRVFYGRKINWAYMNRITVKMRSGGKSNSGLSNKILIAKEIHKSLNMNNIFTLYFFQVGRYLIRLMELLIKPAKKSM